MQCKDVEVLGLNWGSFSFLRKQKSSQSSNKIMGFFHKIIIYMWDFCAGNVRMGVENYILLCFLKLIWICGQKLSFRHESKGNNWKKERKYPHNQTEHIKPENYWKHMHWNNITLLLRKDLVCYIKLIKNVITRINCRL